MNMRIPQIQGIRALAIIGIFLSHSIWTLDIGENNPVLLRGLSNLGSSGVFTFFILSGMLLVLNGREIQRNSLWKSIKLAWKRIKRLYPLHVLMLIICLILKWPDTIKEWFWTIVCLPLNLTLTQDLVPFVGVLQSFNNVAWFLSAFFLIWVMVYMAPNICNTISNTSFLKALMLGEWIVVIHIIYRYCLSVFPYHIIPHDKEVYFDYFWYFNPLLCYTEFILGCCLGRCLQALRLDKKAMNILQALMLFSFVPVLMIPNNNVFYQPLMEIVILLGVFAVIARPRGWGGRFLSTSILVFIGDISAYIFLIHGAVLYGLREVKDYLIPHSIIWLAIIGTIICSIIAMKIIDGKSMLINK